ncbi:hypothetical protein [Candidatus Chromulinivorax destructor]|uniref:Uncharacterized protein n=1 Tax=Candidatus Chromulinivorax destructor TaxID=2066483 RepID=A0A345ZBV0_9BACT|nr:hypothetical protein [Candidatus Chromulinivorax destructor]AXK60767.1 hypothetical protein C0J27_03390 [Candidatus Chromulinivorax destructor]
MQIKKKHLFILVIFLPIILFCAEQNIARDSLKQRSHSCPQQHAILEQLYIPHPDPNRHAYSYKDPKKCYSPLQSLCQKMNLKEQELEVEKINFKKTSNDHESDCESEVSDHSQTSQDLDSGEECLFEIDDIDTK